MPDKLDILKKYFGYTSFRGGQEKLIDALLDGRDVLGIMPTGAGKSLCYQIPTLMFSGITVVISPLISLMQDQVSALIQQGVKAAYLNRSLSESQYERALRNFASGMYKIVYVAPERLDTPRFSKICQSLNISLVAVDEAHCVSQWGQDFRPSYLGIKKFISQLPRRPIVGAFTATATEQVKRDIINLLCLHSPKTVTTGFDRPNLYFGVMNPVNKTRRLIELLKERSDRAGIVYCSTRKAVEEVCKELNLKGFDATMYHAGMDEADRTRNQNDFVYDRKQIMVATNAFGMGIDKSNVSFVIHYNMPKNLESYYQEAGRAGRDGGEAECILLYGEKDVATIRFFIEQSGLNSEQDEAEKAAFTKLEYDRLNYMRLYCKTTECLRGYMLRYFGDSSAPRCENCSNCEKKFKTVDITIEAQKILSCIKRMNENYGAKMIIDVLRGSDNRRVKDLCFDKLSTYGIMSKTKPADIRRYIEKLEELGYLKSVGAGYPVLKLTDMCYPLLKGKVNVSIKETLTLKAKNTTKFVPSGIDSALLDKLKALRTAHASKRGVPAYVIFSDATLVDMCRIKPVTDNQFLSVNGVGAAKLERYGEEFMAVIREHTRLSEVSY